MSSDLRPAPVRHVSSATECDFYHSLNIPGHGEVKGQWDLRGGERDYIGHVKLKGKTVLEIGPASGYMTFWMERQGAQVSCLDLSEDHKWDFVPFKNMDMDAHNAARRTHLQRLHNSWWYTREAYRSSAEMMYGTVYDIDSSIGTFDVVTLSSILLHLRDPFKAIELAASVCKETIIITDVAEEHVIQDNRALKNHHVMYFLPRKVAQNIDAWFFIPPRVISEFLRILGFDKITISSHRQKFGKETWPLYTVVANRS